MYKVLTVMLVIIAFLLTIIVFQLERSNNHSQEVVTMFRTIEAELE